MAEPPIFDSDAGLFRRGNPVLHAPADAVVDVDHARLGHAPPREPSVDPVLAFVRIVVVQDARLRVEQVRRDRGLSAERIIVQQP
jgi:hypothetical protein